MSVVIEPRVLKGFRDILPDQELERLRIVGILQQTFSMFGFVPIDTPILEYSEVLLGKGGGETDKQVYRFNDQGGRDVAMRYDLTVPFARFMAAHRNELYVPFKRYHIGKAFRGENTQRGRYREFMQCDFDIVGTETLSADLEIVVMIDAAFQAIGVDRLTIHVSHRGVLNELLASLGVGKYGVEVLRTVDKLQKIGADQVKAKLEDLIGTQAATAVLAFITATGTNDAIVKQMKELVPNAAADIERLRQIVAITGDLGTGNRVVIDTSITRGLDYYTGIVFETFLDDQPAIGSVCSGGRYDDLAGLYTKERLPGVGASIGLDRLMAALEDLPRHRAAAAVDTLVVCVDPALTGHYHAVARDLRAEGLRAEVFLEPRKLGQQFAFAERKGIATAVICGPDEIAKGRVNVRNIATRESAEGLTLADAAAWIQATVRKRA
jgi:histidyl-tRNA synthetase